MAAGRCFIAGITGIDISLAAGEREAVAMAI